MPPGRRTRRKIARRALKRGPPPRISLWIIGLLALIAAAIGLSRAIP
jgi:hypothetical protein